MANELMITKSTTEHYLSIATPRNYEDVVNEIYNTEMACKSNGEITMKIVRELYEQYVEIYDMIPELADIVDEVTFYNGNVFEKMAQVMQKNDPAAIGMYERGMAQFVDGHFVYQEQELVTEIIEQIVCDLTTEMNRDDDDLGRSDIAKILSKHDLPFILDYEDDIYECMKFLQDSGHAIIVNDCQNSFFPELYDAYLDKLYDQPRFYDKRYGRYSVIKVADRQHSGAMELGYEKGW